MIHCTVYRSDRKPETYLFLARDMAYSDLPPALQQAFGEPAFVMDLQLTAGRKLARVDTRLVLEELTRQGYFLQMPPELPVEEEISRRFSGTPRSRR